LQTAQSTTWARKIAVIRLQQEFNMLSDSDKQTFLTRIVEQRKGHTEVTELKAEISQIN
jgi:hypothetical protein